MSVNGAKNGSGVATAAAVRHRTHYYVGKTTSVFRFYFRWQHRQQRHDHHQENTESAQK